MITKNFDIWKKAFPLSNQKSDYITIPEMTSIENIKVNQMNAMQSSNYQVCGLGVTDTITYASTSSYYLTFIWIGKSSADETYDDYALDAFSTSEVSAAAHSVVRTIDGDTISLSISREFTNISGSAITVNEVGFLKSLSCKKSSDSTNYYSNYLFDRRKLETPITIEAGAKHTFTFVIVL